MCRSGSERGKPSADFLREAGLNAYYVVNGFQGSAIKEGEHAGFVLKMVGKIVVYHGLLR